MTPVLSGRLHLQLAHAALAGIDRTCSAPDYTGTALDAAPSGSEGRRCAPTPAKAHRMFGR